MFGLRPGDLDHFTGHQLRVLADRSDEVIRAANRAAAEQNGNG